MQLLLWLLLAAVLMGWLVIRRRGIKRQATASRDINLLPNRQASNTTGLFADIEFGGGNSPGAGDDADAMYRPLQASIANVRRHLNTVIIGIQQPEITTSELDTMRVTLKQIDASITELDALHQGIKERIPRTGSSSVYRFANIVDTISDLKAKHIATATALNERYLLLMLSL
jgi:hypothetical protein